MKRCQISPHFPFLSLCAEADHLKHYLLQPVQWPVQSESSVWICWGPVLLSRRLHYTRWLCLHLQTKRNKTAFLHNKDMTTPVNQNSEALHNTCWLYRHQPIKHSKAAPLDTLVVVVVAFSSLARIWGECLINHSLPVLFFFFFKVEISSCTLIPLFRPGSIHSGSASRDESDQAFPDELCASLFPDRSHTMPGQWHSQPTPTSLGQRCMHV